MKKSTYLLTLLLTALFCLPWGSNVRADELTVADGTATNSNVPVWGNWCDAEQHNQLIYPSSLLTELEGKNITKLTFYVASKAAAKWTSTFTIGLTVVDESSITGDGGYWGSYYHNSATVTPVYNGELDGTGSTMVVEFSEAFYYEGGNLLFDLTSTGGIYKDATFYGANQSATANIASHGSKTATSSSTGSTFLPKTTFTYEAAAAVTCAKPSALNNTALSASSATFTWTAGGSESEWQYLCLPAATTLSDSHWESASVQTTTSAAATVDGLSPTTDYKFYVRANCGATDGVSKEISAAFTTPCASITLPWNLDLSGATNNTILDCWDISGSTSTTKSGSGSYNIWGVYSAGGTKMLRMNNYNVAEGTALINTPNIVVPNDGKNYELVFDYENSAYKSTTNLSLYVKASTDGGSTFTELGSYEKNSSVSYDGTPADFVEETVSLADYAGETIILQFFANANYGYGAMFVKNIRIIAASSCTKPSALSCTAVTANSATLSWSAGGSETAWNIRYKADGDADWSEVAVTAAQLIDGKYTIPGLSDNTHYTAQVQANCGGEQSEWNSTAVSFTTLCNPFTMKFSENFDDLTAGIPDCWDNAEGTTTNDAYKWNYFATGYSGKCVRFEALYNVNGNDNYLKTPLITVSEAALLSFRYKNPKGAALSVYYTVDGGEKQVLISSLETKTGWSDAVEQNLPDACIGHQVSIWFKAVSNCSYGDAYIYLDNVEVKKQPTCLTPTALSYSNVTAESVILSWTAGGTESAWKVQYSTNNSDWSDAVDATTNPFTLTGLSEQTTYYVRVAANCGDSESEYTSTTVSFKTKCAAISSFPWTEDFEDETNETNVACWDNSTSTCFSNAGGSTPSQYVWGVVRTGSYGDYKYQLYMRNFNVRSGTALINTPSFTLPNDKDMQLVFNYSHLASCNPLEVKVSENGETFTSIGGASYANDPDGSYSYSSPGTYKEATINLSDYKGKTITLQFFTTANYGDGAIWIDNVKIEQAPSCFKPTLNEASAITPDGATFSWTASGKGETQYQYVVVATGETPDWSAATLTDELTATVSGKAAGTYDFYVRSYCGTEDQSEAVSKSFTTATIPAPTSVTVSAITNNAASAAWTAPEVTYPVQYQWKTSQTGSEWSSPTADLSAALSGLEANTEYTIYVRTYYSTGVQSAEATQTFTTACNPIVVSAAAYEEHFDAFPACWDNSEGTTTTASYKWSSATGGEDGNCVRFEGTDNGPGKTNVLASPLFELNADADLTFYWKNAKTGEYKVQIAVDGGAREDLVTGLVSNNAWQQKEVSLGAYKNHTIQLFFCGTSISDGNANLWLDELAITPQACRKPAALNEATAITSEGATFTWTAGGTATDYQYAVAEAGAAESALVWNNISAQTVTLNGLQPSTSYDFYVRTYCDEEHQSEARKVSFKTACGVYSLPFEQDFNTVAAYTIPECWNNEEGTLTEDYQRWRTDGYSIKFNSSTNEAGSYNVLATPQIQLGNGKYLLTFQAKNPTGGAFKVQIEGEGIAREDLLNEGLTGLADWTLKYVEIPAKFANKKVQLFFHATSNEGDANAYISVDDIRVARGEVFSDTENNESRFATLAAAGETMDVIFNRTLLYSGDYNTLCLPFSLSAEQIANSPLADFKLKAFDYASVAGGELQIAICGASSIEAGVPYFAAYQGEPMANQTQQVFENVVITASAPGSVNKTDVKFVGVFNPYTLTAQAEGDAHNILYLAAGNTIYWPGQDKTVKGFRAYFDATAGPALSIRRGMPVRIVERAEVTTGYENIQMGEKSLKLLENNQVVIIRNGVKYNVQGQVIR